MCFPSQYCCPWAKPYSGFSIGGQVLRPKFERRDENEFGVYIDKDQAKLILVLDLRVCYCLLVLMIRIRSSYFSPKPKSSNLKSKKKKKYSEIAYMKVVYRSSYRKAGTLSWTDQSSDIPDYKYMIQIPQSSIVSPVFVRLTGNRDQDNSLKLEREFESLKEREIYNWTSNFEGELFSR